MFIVGLSALIHSQALIELEIFLDNCKAYEFCRARSGLFV
jgi:hypothetical protein